MELRHLRYFLAVCEEMNFTKAAEKLMIAQPPLSRQIKDLEDELGAPLFIREHHQLKLTDEGIMFKQYAARIMGLADKSMDDIRQMHTGLKGTLYIAGVEGKAPRIISNWIAGFIKEYPEVEFSLWNGNTDDVNARIRKGLCDVAVLMEPYDPQGMHSIPIYSEPWVAIFSSDHPLAKENVGQPSVCKDGTVIPGTIPLASLADYDLIIPSRSSRLREISDWFAPLGKTVKVKARIANVLNAYELCRSNVGVSIFPAATTDLVHSDDVQIRTIVEPSFTASYLFVYSAEHPLSPVARRFVEYVQAMNV